MLTILCQTGTCYRHSSVYQYHSCTSSSHFLQLHQNVVVPIELVAVWLSGNVVGQINEVTLRRAGLMLRWVTVRGV